MQRRSDICANRHRILKTILTVALSLIIAINCSACSDTHTKKTTSKEDDEIVIAMTLMNYSFPIFHDMLATARLAAEEQNVKLIDLDSKGSMENQANIMNDFLYAMDVDVICLNPVDSDAVGNLVLEANEVGIPVVTVDVGSANGYVDVHIASDNMEIGRIAGRHTVELLTEAHGTPQGTVFVIGYPQISSMRLRVEGYKEILSDYPGINLVERNPIKLNSDQNMRMMEDLLQSYPSGTIDVVFGASGTTMSGLLAATESAGRGDFLLISVDSPPEILTELQDPSSALVASVVQFPTEMAKEAIETCVKIAKGENIEQREVHTTIELVTKDTIGDYLDRMSSVHQIIEPYKY